MPMCAHGRQRILEENGCLRLSGSFPELERPMEQLPGGVRLQDVMALAGCASQLHHWPGDELRADILDAVGVRGVCACNLARSGAKLAPCGSG